MSMQDTVALIERYYAAFNRSDDSWLSAIDELGPDDR